MSLLQDFYSNLESTLARGESPPYKCSGVACIESLDGAVLYSASLYPIDASLSKITAEQANHLFKNMTVDGFSYHSVEILTFLSTSKLPPPYWRVQLKYRHQ